MNPNIYRMTNSAYADVVKLLVGNKVDQNRVVSREQAEEWAKARGMLFAESSAKTTEGVSQVFSEVVQQVRCLTCLVFTCFIILLEFALKLNSDQLIQW